MLGLKLNHNSKRGLSFSLSHQGQVTHMYIIYRQISNIRCTKSHQIPNFKCFLSRLAVVFAQSIGARYWVKNENVVGAAPPGDAPITSEWSTILLPNRVASYIRGFTVCVFVCKPDHLWFRWWLVTCSAPNMYQTTSSSLVQIMAWCQTGSKALPKPKLTCQQ